MIKKNYIIICRNPYFIGILSAINIYEWFAPHLRGRNPYFIGILSAIESMKIDTITYDGVAILILLESFLQYGHTECPSNFFLCRNPYFIGILSAIELQEELFKKNNRSRNPYFIGILSAIQIK